MPEDSYNFDVYRIKLEKAESFFSLQISNVISWEIGRAHV